MHGQQNIKKKKYLFCVARRANSDYFLMQHLVIFITDTDCVCRAVRIEPSQDNSR